MSACRRSGPTASVWSRTSFPPPTSPTSPGSTARLIADTPDQLAVEVTVKAIWTAQYMGIQQALATAPTLVNLVDGTTAIGERADALREAEDHAPDPLSPGRYQTPAWPPLTRKMLPVANFAAGDAR